jgi:hypothetical protein
VWLLFFLLCGVALTANPPAQFREHSIATDLKGGYQVLAVDLNHDGRKDILALASGMSELVWFENPGWQRRVIAGGLSRMINVAPVDADGDGIPELVLASGFSMDPSKSDGTVSLLKHKGDPREPWEVTEIDRLPASHRLRTADIDGTGKEAVINLPLAGAQATPPDYRDHVPIVCYRAGVWKREPVSDELEGVAHGITVIDWDGDGRDEFLTASFQGIHLFRLGNDKRWSKTQLARGNPAAWPKCGSSDIAVGRLGGTRFLCAIEPWHGNEVVVYRQHGGDWERTVIDDSFVQGHTIVAADLNHDGLDEIVAGYRGEGHKVVVYSARGDGWTRSVIDDGVPVNACDVADLNGDGRPDIVCIGGADVKWYENAGKE